MEKIKQYVKEIFKIIQKPGMKILPGQIAFFLVLSIIPIFTLVGYIASMFSISIDSLIRFMSETFPSEVFNLLIPFVSGTGFDANVFLFMVTGFILASNGPHSIVIASNELFHMKHQDYLTSRIKAFFMTIILVVLFLFILVVLGFGNMILKYIIDLKIFSFITKELYFIFVLIKWPLAFFLIFYSMKLIYTLAPSKKIPSKYMNRGAFVATLGFTFVTAIYSYYVSNFANYDLFYGSLSNVIILMLWVYILSYIITLGIAINAASYSELEENNSHNNSLEQDNNK